MKEYIAPAVAREPAFSIVLVDPVPGVLTSLAGGLETYGYAATGCAPDECLSYLDDDLSALILGPGIRVVEAISLCEAARHYSNIPILALLRTPNPDQQSLLLDSGVDQTLVSEGEFSPRLVLSALRAVERRNTLARQLGGDIIEAGPLRIDLYHRTVRLHGQPVPLTATEFTILAFLARRAGQVMRAVDIVRELHGYDADETAAQDLVKVHISRLRQKLEQDPEAPRYIVNIRGQGYMYVFERRGTNLP